MGNKAKDDDLYQEMCRVVGKVVLEMRDLGQEPKHIVIAGVLRTSLANRKIQRSPLTVEAMEKVIHALSGHLRRRVRKSRSGSPPGRQCHNGEPPSLHRRWRVADRQDTGC